VTGLEMKVVITSTYPCFHESRCWARDAHL